MAKNRGAANLAGLAALGALGYMLRDKQKASMGGGDESVFTGPMEVSPEYTRAVTEGLKTEGPESVGGSTRDFQSMEGVDLSTRQSRGAPRPASTPKSRPTQSMGSREQQSRDLLKQVERDMYYGKPQDPRETDKPLEGVYPESYLIAPGAKTMSTLAKGLANRPTQKIPEYVQPTLSYAERQLLEGPAKRASQQLLEAPTKRLTGPSKADLLARDRAARAAARQDEMLKENARRYGLNPEAPGYEGAARAVRDRLGDDAFTLKKRGGAVKAKKMASGGMTRSSASKRADGIAQKGKTRGKMY